MRPVLVSLVAVGVIAAGGAVVASFIRSEPSSSETATQIKNPPSSDSPSTVVILKRVTDEEYERGVKELRRKQNAEAD